MAGEAEATVASLNALQSILISLQAGLNFNLYQCPEATLDTITSIGSFDYVVVGAGTAGMVMANRLSENPNKTVLLIERGVCPPIESSYAGLFPTEPLNPNIDYMYDIEKNGYVGKNQQSKGLGCRGKMVGGTGGLDHLIHAWCTDNDISKLAVVANDSTWSDLAKYMKKQENVIDTGVLAQNTTQHGVGGVLTLQRQVIPDNEPIIRAIVELLSIPHLNDKYENCVVEPVFSIGDGKRQNGNLGYLNAEVMGRKNLYLLTNASATKVNMNGINATGVQFTKNGVTYNVIAKKEVILCTGTYNSPQLLMLSGIGNETYLKNMGIESVVQNDEVGMNYKDHTGVCMFIALDNDTSVAAAADPHKWPGPLTNAYFSSNSSQPDPDMLAITLLFPHDSAALLQVCVQVFKYSLATCNKVYAKNVGRRMLFMALLYLRTESVGTVLLNSTDPEDQPIIRPNLFTEANDISNITALVGQMGGIVNTTEFLSLGAEIVDVTGCDSNYTKYSDEYWECYSAEMSLITTWNVAGTCAMGKVLDSKMRVIGANNLRVVDGASLPFLPRAELSATIRGVAEKIADSIKADS